MPIKHAKLSASGSHRWLYCPASVKACQGIKEKKSVYADEGSMAHELADLVLNRGGSCYDWEGKHLIEWNAQPVTREMCDTVQEYVDYVRALGGTQMYEQRVDFSPWVADGFGTSDAMVFKANKLYIIDLKMGKGVKVSAKENTQAILYALGAVNEFGEFADFDTVVISIVQPRIDHIDEWEISKGDLLKWGEWISQRAELALSDNPPFQAGEKQCLFCKAKPTCKELERVTHQAIKADFDNLDALESPDSLTDERLAEILSVKKVINSWLEAVEKHLKEKAARGEHVDGFKLVAGRSLRRWSSENKAKNKLLELLGDDAFERKLLSVAKAEKLLGKQHATEIKELIIKPMGKPALVPESDPREAINISSDDFDLLNDDED